MNPKITIDCFGTKKWRLNRQLHRENGPAVIGGKNGFKIWYVNGKRHREDGPAYNDILLDTRLWFLGGRVYFQDEWFRAILLDRLK